MILTETQLRKIVRTTMVEIGMSRAAMGSNYKDIGAEQIKKIPKQSMCQLMKMVMSYVHLKSNFAKPKVTAAVNTIKGEEGWKEKYEKFVKMAKKKPDKAAAIIWRQQIVGTTMEVVDTVVDYIAASASGSKDAYSELPPAVTKYIDENVMEKIKKTFSDFIQKAVLKRAAIQGAAVAAAVPSGGLTLTVNAALALKAGFDAVSCSEELNDYADELVGTSGVRMKKLIPDVEGASKGYKTFAAAVLS